MHTVARGCSNEANLTAAGWRALSSRRSRASPSSRRAVLSWQQPRDRSGCSGQRERRFACPGFAMSRRARFHCGSIYEALHGDAGAVNDLLLQARAVRDLVPQLRGVPLEVIPRAIGLSGSTAVPRVHSGQRDLKRLSPSVHRAGPTTGEDVVALVLRRVQDDSRDGVRMLRPGAVRASR